jgi:Patatin-like phospholipase
MQMPDSLPFHLVAKEELEAIDRRRTEACGAVPSDALKDRLDKYEKGETGAAADLPGSAAEQQRKTRTVRLAALDHHLAGLSFSGGGIRSATFAVGILQGLASLGLLRRFDYVSTVSGGGYAGAWLAAWIKRDGDPSNVESLLKPSRVQNAQADRGVYKENDVRKEYLKKDVVVDEEPEPLYHLREYSSFMMPRPGAFSPDTWTIIAIWVRNFLVNLLVLLPITMLAVVLARLTVWGYSERAWSGAILGLGIASFYFYFKAFLKNAEGTGEIRARAAGQIKDKSWLINQKDFYSEIVLFMLLAGVGFTLSYPTLGPMFVEWIVNNTPLYHIPDEYKDIRSLVVHMVLFGGSLGGIATFFGFYFHSGGWFRVRVVLAATVSGAIGGLLLYLSGIHLLSPTSFNAIDRAVFAPPISLSMMVASMVAEVALIGWRVDEAEREWWARLSAVLLLAAMAWAVAFGTILYLPELFLAAKHWALKSAITAGWIGVTIAGVQAGRTLLGQLKGVSIRLSVVAAVAPLIFLAGLLCAVSLLVALLISSFAPDGVFRYRESLMHGDFWALLKVTGIALVVLLIGWKIVDVNLFSLNSMYVNRLVRCYLGASRPQERWGPQDEKRGRWGESPDPRRGGGAPIRSQGVFARGNLVTGFDLGDDLPLKDLSISLEPGQMPYRGPFPLINTSLNLVAGKDLALRDRKCAPFIFTPLHCGSKVTGYTYVAPDTHAAKPDETTRYSQFTLGRVIAISGASVDPNMNVYQSAGLTALLTVLNARLGYWVENPKAPGRSSQTSSAEGPSYAKLLVAELLGKTDENSQYVHLSDGGHFENLGVYELIRRRCRYIVACDAGEDDTASDENLANLVRLCRIDFGIRLALDTDPLKLGLPGRLASSHVVIGKIRYDDVDNGQMPGILIYVKITMTGDEPTDVQNYASLHSRFPNDFSDLRQTFDEAQFESYRALGDHIARVVFEDSVKTLRTMNEELWPGEARFRAAKERFAQAELRLATAETELAKAKAAEQAPPGRASRILKRIQSVGQKAVTPTVAVTKESAQRTRDQARKEYDQALRALEIDENYIQINQKLFATVRNRWSDQVPDQIETYLESTKAWIELQRDLRNDPRLADLSRDLYPERLAMLDLTASRTEGGNGLAYHDTPAERERAELHAVGQMLQIMEDSWSRLRLEGSHDLPMHRGWMNVFRRWSNTEAFHRLWPSLCSEFSVEFVEFCRSELHLIALPTLQQLGKGVLPSLHDNTPTDPAGFLALLDKQPHGPDYAAIFQLAAEFEREWPARANSSKLEPGIVDLLKTVLHEKNGKQNPLAWLVRHTTLAKTTSSPVDQLAAGIMLCRPWDSATYPKDGVLEFFVWIRPVLRSCGIGTRCVADALEAIKKEKPGKEIRVRYRAWKFGGGSAMAVDAWRSFFSLYDFRDIENRPEYQTGDEQVLSLKLTDRPTRTSKAR